MSNAIFLFLLTLTVSRLLGPSLFGIYSFLTTVVLTGSYLSNYGLDTLMVREVVKNQSIGKKYLSNILGLKIVTSFVTIVLILIIFELLLTDAKTKSMLMVLSISLIFNSLSQTLWYYGDCFKKFIYHSMLWTVSNFFKAVIGIIIIIVYRDISLLIWGLLFAEIISFIIAYCLIQKQFGSYSISFDFSVWYDLTVRSTPLAIGAIFSALYFRLDIIMLKLMKTDQIVGYYSAAYKLIEAFTIIPSAIIMVLFPSLVEYHHADMTLFKEKMRESLVFFFITGLILAIFLSVFSEKIILLIFGNAFSPSILALQILSWALFFMFINYLFSHSLISSGREKTNTFYLVFITVVNIGLNFLLIPRYEHIGAGYATLISEVILVSCYYFSIKSYISK